MLNDIIENGKKCYKCRLKAATKGANYCRSCAKIMGRETQFKDFVRRVTRSAVQQGIISKKPCQKCGDENSHAHHNDYHKPFDVIWLCKKHHHQLHSDITHCNKL